MVVKETIQIGHPALKSPNKPVEDFFSEQLSQLIQDLRETMHENLLIGMAAPQIGENFQVFVTEPRETKDRSKDQADEFRVYINPKLVEESAEKSIIYEGCGSVLNGKLFGPVVRPRWITIEASNLEGRRFRFSTDGILARVILHEYDHLSGIEFTEKISDYKKLMHVKFYRERIKDAPEHVEACKITIKDYELL